MPATRRTEGDPPRRRRPASNPEDYERQIAVKALRLVEQQIDQGTVSAQVLSHYVKYASTEAGLQREKLRRENDLLESKIESMASARRVEELYEEAIAAMRSYGGDDEDEATFDD